MSKKNVEAEIKAANAAAVKESGRPLSGRKKAKDVLIALLGAFCAAYATEAIMLPAGLTFGGITGLAKIFQELLGWNYSIVYYALSFIIMLVVWISLGFEEVKKIVLMAIATPGFMMILEQFDVTLLKNQDIFLSVLYCGAVFGICNGLTFLAGFSSGGSDSIAKIIKVKSLPYINLNTLTFALNMLVVIISAFFFGVNVALYAIVTMYISLKIGEAVLYGMMSKLVEIKIITEKPDELTEYVMNELGRGVSSSDIVGEYTGEHKRQLKIICTPRESFIIRRHLANLDQKAFATIVRVDSVWGVGRGFSDINKIDR